MILDNGRSFVPGGDPVLVTSVGIPDPFVVQGDGDWAINGSITASADVQGATMTCDGAMTVGGTITTTGNVGIGVSPSHLLHVYYSAGNEFKFNSGYADFLRGSKTIRFDPQAGGSHGTISVSGNNNGLGLGGALDQAHVEVGAAGDLSCLVGSFQQRKGADKASATELTLSLGNVFDVTGTTTINTISGTGWQAGSVIVLQFDGACTVTHNSGGTNDILLSGSANLTTAAGTVLQFYFDGTDWREMSRTVA